MLAASAFAVLLAAALPLIGRTVALREPAEVVAVLEASCAGCDWGQRGHEAAALELRVDGLYSQHLFLTRGEARSAYPVTLGRLAAGEHRVEVFLDERRSARHARQAEVHRSRSRPSRTPHPRRACSRARRSSRRGPTRWAASATYRSSPGWSRTR